MSHRSPIGRRPRSRSIRLVSTLALALVVLSAPASAFALTGYPDNFNPLLVISDFNWRNSASMSQSEIQAFLDSQGGVLKTYACEEGGPDGQHLTSIKPASQIIAEAAQYYNLNPKLIIATLEKEQSLISQPWHTGQDIDPTSTHLYSTVYHLTNAMGCGVYTGSPDRHPGFGDQVWTGASKLAAAPGASSTSSYAWYPGKIKTVYSYPDKANIDIAPQNQATWNLYTYTPYYPQFTVWKTYEQWFGDPRIDAVDGRVNRFYNKQNGSHFYTASADEAQYVARSLSNIYAFEGAAYSLDTTSGANGQPLFRFYKPSNGTHFYTATPEERDTVIRTLSKIYKYEGPAYMVSTDPAGRTPVYRFYNYQLGSHFYTIDPTERDWVIATLGWKYKHEGVAYFVALAY